MVTEKPSDPLRAPQVLHAVAVLDVLATCVAEQREVTMASWTCPSRCLPVEFTRAAELALIASVLVRFIPA